MPGAWVFPALALVGLAIYRLLQIGSRPKDYPPGPPTIPILGNLHLMPKENNHVQFKKWAEEYGYDASLPRALKMNMANVSFAKTGLLFNLGYPCYDCVLLRPGRERYIR